MSGDRSGWPVQAMSPGREQELMEAIAAEFPATQVRYVVGYIALPADVTAPVASTLDGLLGKLREALE